MIKARLHYVFLFVFVFVTCRSDTDSMDKIDGPSFVFVFDQFYKFMDERYVFWDIDATDWDTMRQYRPQFENLNIASSADQLEAISLFTEMTRGLIDHHFEIEFVGDGVRGLRINPGLQRKVEEGFPVLFNTFPEVRALLETPIHQATFAQNSQFLTGMLNEHTLLFKVNQFNLYQSYTVENNLAFAVGLDWFFQQAATEQVSQIILDLRSCTGGGLIDLDFFIAPLLKADITFGYTKFKQSRIRDDYTALIPAVLKARWAGREVPEIIVLTDERTASLAETIAYIVQRHGLGKIVGSPTYGATSPVSDSNVFHSGPTNIADFMLVRTSSVQFLGIEKNSLEGWGVAPNIAEDAIVFLRQIKNETTSQ